MIRRLAVLLIFPVLLAGSIIMSQSGVHNPHGELKWDCQDCHTTDSWSKMRDSLRFDHAQTGFPLVGAHSAAACIGCHKDPVFSHVSSTCLDCHTDHHQGELGTDCLKCHNTVDWVSHQNTFELHAARGFALVGAHTVADCEACHIGSAKKQFAGTPTNCYSCHKEDFQATVEPAHARLGFSTECQDCHSAAKGTWAGASFTHPASFPLIGGHHDVACQACHKSGYAGTPTDCYSCHAANFLAASNPNHAAGGFPHDCSTCHTIMGWQPANYDHNATAFPLTGAHAQVLCMSCHATQFAGTPTACFACHQTDFNASREPNHQLAAFGHDCLTCHTTAAWKPSSFNHATTGFILTGAHTAALCSSCHATKFAGTPSDCFSCHQTDFSGTTSPNHVSQGFSHDCTSCHSTSAWSPSTFNHAATAFPLTGKHVTVACLACHPSQYTGTPSTCIACHQTDFNQSTEPNHQLAGFGTNCLTCHTTAGWTPSSFNHSSTGFVLTGAHTSALCSSCHATKFAGTPSDCYSCHQTDFSGTTSPNHVSQGFSHDCTSCHSTTAWSPSTFNHATTAFPLTGKHLTATCISCHPSQYAGTPTNCVACHQTDFNGTASPNHTAAHFPTTCQTCHTTSGWTPSTWNHDAQFFRINSGTHSIFTCIQCHTTPSDYALFSCIDCHTHNATTTNAKHSQVNGYQYLSSACYTCHPRG